MDLFQCDRKKDSRYRLAMTKTVIKVSNLSKKYIIGHTQSDTLMGQLSERFSNVFSTSSNNTKEEFWALKDVSFEVKEGEILGIIGKNGAGKSTLLKILSRITPPTKGRIEIEGRVASLLEVGTGFHPELSGKENIFLNGSLLGMTRVEIRKKLDEIIAFSGVEKFIDTPVKHYSSGMYVRLAFAVAAHLDPEILIIDEVLAVGDSEFQKKCLGKMNDVAQQGRTVLFVSHNMSAVEALCHTAILIDNGETISKNNAIDVINQYTNTSSNTTNYWKYQNTKKYSLAQAGHIEEVFIEQLSNQNSNQLIIGVPWQIRIIFQINEKIPHFIVGVGMTSSLNIPIRTSWSDPRTVTPGKYEAIFKEDMIIFGSGIYYLTFGLSSREDSFFL